MWWYQVIHTPTEDGYDEYGIHEVIDIDGTIGWTERPIIVGNSVEELQNTLNKMMYATRYREVREDG